jgi:hypothetical protein
MHKRKWFKRLISDTVQFLTSCPFSLWATLVVLHGVLRGHGSMYFGRRHLGRVLCTGVEIPSQMPLVSGWLRYVSYISPGRETMRTTQPTEPIIARSAVMSMRKPDIRFEVISPFLTAGWEGTIKLGDLGEMAAWCQN